MSSLLDSFTISLEIQQQAEATNQWCFWESVEDIGGKIWHVISLTLPVIEEAQATGMEAVIPPKKNRKNPREYDRYLYSLQYLVKNSFLHLKRWRGIATRYAKNSSSFLATVHIRA